MVAPERKKKKTKVKNKQNLQITSSNPKGQLQKWIGCGFISYAASTISPCKPVELEIMTTPVKKKFLK